jgi:hypothetical protein|eukprot:COSAG06_NODE_970_length_11275_cov_4.727183_11_plen_65_part_00
MRDERSSGERLAPVRCVPSAALISSCSRSTICASPSSGPASRSAALLLLLLLIKLAESFVSESI